MGGADSRPRQSSQRVRWVNNNYLVRVCTAGLSVWFHPYVMLKNVSVKPDSYNDTGAASVTHVISATGKVLFTSQIIFLTLNILTIWLVGHWLALVMQCLNRNQVYSSITPMLVMLHWHQHHNCEPGHKLLPKLQCCLLSRFICHQKCHWCSVNHELSAISLSPY